MNHIAFKVQSGGDNQYDFTCVGCGTKGELGLAVDTVRFNCPEHCGASYIQWDNLGVQTITCVICPIFEE